MNSQHLISIIVPCFNQAEFLDDCLTSVLKQNYSNWECLIINDGSTDDTELIAKKWVVKDSRFNYFEKQNGGLSSARNHGLEKSKGEFILPLDADDKISTEYVSLAIQKLVSNSSLGIVYCDAELFGDENGPWKLEDYTKKELLLKNLIFCSAVYRKADQIKVGNYDEKLIFGYEDWEFWIRMIYENNLQVHKLNHTGFFYRIKKTSMVKKLNRDVDKYQYSLSYIFNTHFTKYIEEFGNEMTSMINEKIEYMGIIQPIKSDNQHKIAEWISKNIRLKTIVTSILLKFKGILSRGSKSRSFPFD